MKGSTIAGIILNIGTLIAMIVVIIFIINNRNSYNTCKNIQSPFCYHITCPCDDPTKGPCKGYSYQDGPKEGSYICSNTPNNLVDIDGNPIG